MPMIITKVVPKQVSKRPLSWWEATIKRMQLQVRTLVITDLVTGGLLTVSRGYTGVYLYFYLQPGDAVNFEGYKTKSGSINSTGESFFRDAPNKPSEAEVLRREDEARDKLEAWWTTLE